MKAIPHISGALVVWILSYVFFLSTLANNFSSAHDSIHYLAGITSGEDLFHPHHLLYHFLGHYWFLFFSAILPAVPDHYLVEAFTAVWGSSVLALVYLFFRNRFYLPRFLALAGVAVCGFSYGLWFYSVNVEVYMPPLFFLLACLYVLTGRKPGSADLWKLAVLHSLAILFHEVNILFVVVVLYVLAAHRKKLSPGTAITGYALPCLLITIGVYFYTGWIVEGKDTFETWVRWMQGYTVDHGFWQPLSAKTPLNVLAGFSRAFIGGHYIFQLPAAGSPLQEAFSSHGLADELFLGSGMSRPLLWSLAGLTVVFAVLFFILAVRFMLKLRTVWTNYPPVKPLLLCLAVYSAFFCFWMPEILEFWIVQMLIVWLLLVGTLPLVKLPFRIPLPAGVWLTAVLLLSLNFFGSIRWLKDIRYDWYYRQVEQVKHRLDAGDLVIVEDDWIIKDYFRYYTRATVLSADEPEYRREAVRERAEKVQAAGGKVYLYQGKLPAGAGRGGRFIQSY